ncbi:hypothetical protein [Nocardioides sp.]|uniref:hypothetical protein n=1 Tax=Nocardioides sp. TaxID=35761 RepID=UPI002B266D04|nr:hypothetical protein [Nocardioides sp.]
MGALLGCALLLTSCSGEEEPFVPPSLIEEAPVPAYDPALEPAAAAMALVPSEATVLAVTDYDELRLRLAQSELTSESSAAARDRFWRNAARRTVMFSDGLLRGVDERLLDDYGFTQDDVIWEARWGTPSGEGWVLRLRDDLDLDGVARAIRDGVGPLDGADFDAGRRLISLDATDEPTDSWAADPARTALVGRPATSTYVDSACIPYDVAFADGDASDLAPAPAEEMGALDELGPFAVSYGVDLVTVHLGQVRNDVFDRARLPDILPRTDPEFAVGYVEPVADPSGGRIGYTIGDPAAAESLARQRHLPFAVCSL